MTGTGSLTIRGVGVEDSGQYQCVAGNEEEESQDVATLLLGGNPRLFVQFVTFYFFSASKHIKSSSDCCLLQLQFGCNIQYNTSRSSAISRLNYTLLPVWIREPNGFCRNGKGYCKTISIGTDLFQSTDLPLCVKSYLVCWQCSSQCNT